jgi:uncharacterized repeat protein (TIGR01451 family)
VTFGVVLLAGLADAIQVRQKPSRFDKLVIHDPGVPAHVAAAPVDALPADDPMRIRWEAFRAAHPGAWAVSLDRRTGAPLLVEGRGIKFIHGGVAPTLEGLAAAMRTFAGGNRALFLADTSEMVLNAQASGPVSPHVWQVVFDRQVGGVPVAGDRYIFAISHGNLVQFGATRWSPVSTSRTPALTAADARARLYAYMGIEPTAVAKVVEGGTLRFIPLRAGDGYRAALAWKLAIVVKGEPGTWEGLVDAHGGAVLALYDGNHYAQVKGGVYPQSNDGEAPGGTEEAGWPMPFADVTIDGSEASASTMGVFACGPSGAAATSNLDGPYVRIQDNCGAIAQSVTCGGDLDFGQGAGTDCAVPAGASAGDTHASRTGFYHLNRAAEHGRSWLPGVAWLSSQLTSVVNINDTCNAFWQFGTVHFFKSGNGCGNTGELPGVVLHEWGHGLDQNDGGDYDNPSEAYADVTALLQSHLSCMGRGFEGGNCGGYGNACLDCTGIRDQDWDKRAEHAPSTPTGFIATCSPGSGPCGKETHCEGYLAAETMWDLATRDLPASGLDAATAWQLVDRLWYTSRAGSGGNAYNCDLLLGTSDGCAVNSWFSKLRVQDDDDGNLANGTPHAAAIFAAFNRHGIACGLAADASNQSTTICPTLAAPVLTVAPGSAANALSWSAVPGAARYRVLRTDQGCDTASTAVAVVAAPATGYDDTGLINGFTTYYRVQAVAANPACDGAVSACRDATPQPFAGTVSFDAASYRCDGTITLSVLDGNTGVTTLPVHVMSATEPAGEPVTLTEAAPGSTRYTGSIPTTSGAPAADGSLSVAEGDAITATYVDADDGEGGTGVVRTATAVADCTPPVITAVQATDVTGKSARITWTTDEKADSEVLYAQTPPPAAAASSVGLVTAHTVTISGLAECTEHVFSVQSTDAPGNVATDDAAGAYHTFSTLKNTQPVFDAGDTPVAIPDFDPNGASSAISVADAKQVVDVDVRIHITHTYDGDLSISLIAPNGTEVMLSDQHGGSGGNYEDTVFDDEAANAIASGSAPFAGSYRPDSPLSVLDGITSSGTWRLRVVDRLGDDVGTIDSWSLILSYPSRSCGPHASFNFRSTVADTCGTGGPGHGNTIWDPGEQVQFRVNLKNDGSVPLTGVVATIAGLTPGLTIVDGAASYPDLAVEGSANSLSPHFTALLPQGLACGSQLAFGLTVTSNEGTWGGTFGATVGLPISPGGISLDETFDDFPGNWTVVNGGSGGGAAATWMTGNPGDRPILSPLQEPVAIVDSDWAGMFAFQDEQLISEPVSLVGATTALLDFDQFFHWYSSNQSEIGDVDVRSSATGGAWVNKLRQQGGDSANPAHVSIDLTAEAAGAPDVQIRFHYYNARFEWYWQLDNVRVSFTRPAGCNQNACVAAPTAVKPVPDGSFGSAMTASRADAAGSSIDLRWDVATCASTGYHVLYGSLATVATHAVAGSACGIGTSGAFSWSGVPAGDLWFVVAADDGASTEGSWGAGATGERGGSSPSGQCGMAAKNLSGTCP